ncbi:metallophosphoesterase [Anaerosporobacter sp.]|uniref:metallophosphoesterase n=1 Tax=Anaerosporobacter sp. TaxID=1872529 RepID=UPI00286F76FD|nr:metallophosphoesterase [Anaerosporobacter sp.]
MIWVFILIAMLLAMGAGFTYLVSRLYKFKTIENMAKGNKKIRIVASIIPVALVTIIIGLIIGYMNAIVCMLHLIMFWLLCDFIFWLIKKYCKKTFKQYYSGLIAVVITIGYLSVGWFLAHHVWETNYIIETEKNVGNLRIIQFADSHVGVTFDGEGLTKYVEQMQKLNPDVVLITGDFVDDDTSKEDMIAACKALGTLQTTYGVYFSFGNHDKGYYRAGYRGYTGDDLIEELEKNKVIVLQDETVLIDDRYYIIGRQDFSEEGQGGSRAQMNELVQGLDKDKFIIVMDHQPHDYKNEAEEQVDLVLSGHTHGGQFFPITYVGEWTGENDKTYGLEKRKETNFIVTSGISDWAIKFKTGCKSEFVVVDVEGK